MSKLHWLLPPLYFAALLGLSLTGVEARYSAAALAALAGLHLLLAVTLYLALVVARHLGAVATFLAAAGTALVLVWHCRELTYRPASLTTTALAALALGAGIHALAQPARPPLSLRAALAALAGSALATVLAAALTYQGSTLLRWHLLRHNKLFGTPAYYALAAGVEELEEEIFDRHRPGKESASRNMVEEKRDEDGDEEGIGRPPQHGPHLVFLLLDTLRADALEMGGGRGDMPWLDAYLEGAYRFTDVAANASWTRPSMASMLTGLTPEEHGARDVDDPLEETFVTLAEVAAANGYETAALVSNIGAVGRSAGFAQGFEFFHELAGTPYARAAQVRGTLEQWLDRRAGTDGGERPLFLYLHFLDPHEPYLAGRVPAAKNHAEYTAAYARELAYLDGELARVLELLDERLPGPRAVFVASDHGEEFGEHEEFGHGYSLYGEVIRIPVAFHTGDGTGELDEPLEGRDFFDLLTRWTAGEANLDVAAWAAQKRRRQRHASIYYSSEGRLLLRPYLQKVCMRAVESEGYRMVWSAYGSTFELYEVGRDPREQRNLAAARPDLVERLAALLDESMRRWHFPRAYERSPEELEQLRTLGYIDD